jgi:hypothetical protein
MFSHPKIQRVDVEYYRDGPSQWLKRYRLTTKSQSPTYEDAAEIELAFHKYLASTQDAEAGELVITSG